MKRSDLSHIDRYERNTIEDCMKDRGYRLVQERQLPQEIRREVPPKSLHWRAHGIAGLIKQVESGDSSD